ncbi:MAG: hypothetical protein HC811_10265 [Flammeovirgaceae bacterium]|nr:hypothetical protein [Flammeovirgaceae bacterium]
MTARVFQIVTNRQNQSTWAASWERTRKAWNFKGNGIGSTVYRSEDGGETWTKSAQGFPQGEFVGRIGLDICWSKPNVLYAIVDNQEEVAGEKKEEVASDKLKPADFGSMTKENFLKLDDKKLNDFLRDNRFPRKYDAKRVKKEVTENKYGPKALYDYLGSDANAELFSKK